MFHGLLKQSKDALTTPGKGASSGNASAATHYRDWPATYLDGIQAIDYRNWTLSVEGQVLEPKTFTYTDLANWLHLTQNRRMVSAEGWTYRSEWEGVLLQHIIERVKPKPEATLLRQENLSGHVEFIPVQALIQGRALLCIAEGGKKLTPMYGGPLRLMVFDRYCYKGLGQLSRLDFVTEEEKTPSYWEQKGYNDTGLISPGKYYAFDLKRPRPIPNPGEVTIY